MKKEIAKGEMLLRCRMQKSTHAVRTKSNVRQPQTRPLTGRRLENHVCFADPVMQKIFIFR